MQTQITLDDYLVEEAKQLSHINDTQKIIDLALRAWVSQHKLKKILDLVGQNLIDPVYDVRSVREGMNRDFS